MLKGLITVSGGDRDADKCGRTSSCSLRQHVRAQQLQTWPSSEETGPLGRYVPFTTVTFRIQ